MNKNTENTNGDTDELVEFIFVLAFASSMCLLIVIALEFFQPTGLGREMLADISLIAFILVVSHIFVKMLFNLDKHKW